MNDKQAKLRKLAWIAPLAIVGMVLFVTIGGGIVMLLWNSLLPVLFGLRAISFWQALGILVLCRILFGGFGGGSGRSRSRRSGERIADRVAERVSERLENMTPEQRERFRQRVQDRWGGAGQTRPL
jgi:uncharacterized membrane protein